MADIRIIGGGILGATLAWELAQAGATVDVIDAGISDRASTGSLAWLNVSSTSDVGYARVRAASLRLWRALASNAADCPIALPGSLLWGLSTDLDRHAARLLEAGWQAEVLESDALSSRMPGLAAPERALFAANEGYADPRAITDWMRRQAEAAGARFRSGTLDALTLDGRPTVVTSGSGTAPLLASLGVTLPLRRSPGILMRTAPLPHRVRYVFATPKLDFWQGADGAVFLSSSLSKTPKRADDLMVGDALAELARLFPEFNEAKVVDVVRRDRPIPEDGFPLVGRSGIDQVWLAATHSGMTLAPVIAEALADDILKRAPRHELSRYSPDRTAAIGHEDAAL